MDLCSLEMAKRKFDFDVEADRQLALQYLDELDSDEVASEDDNISVASEADDCVEYIQEVDDVLPVDEVPIFLIW